ncbi:hypothetical protein GGI64_000918 [Rhizobium leguminosarum]|uniref:Uncharacterized protein n=2 Tax=Rhizobium leguminosarum TaxID=384 RepID=A0A7W9ZRU6_RHILE|nr:MULTISPECIES: hypothetical protein [Rhizobium]EJB03205.1 hypothetical protein Rleg9DRAFT_2034 [Rhizobium leguminosarum bv. trifolii WSM597]MBB3647403.1 hypothetical protein [Rhizobium sp. BK619]MBB5663565.1 hypothetical protein [Rhizobium leguminosarum]MBB6220552.1 hypothetical protein [Rhizobium leguminosarum]NYJ09899.1 hypothetical protein [Rhizobium leguminosarum]
MRIMIAVVAFMVASVLSIAILSPSGAGQTGNGNKLEASVNEPVTH